MTLLHWVNLINFAVVDINFAYRWVPVFPEHRQLLGFSWAFEDENLYYYVDNFLWFGLANAPSIFQRILHRHRVRHEKRAVQSYFVSWWGPSDWRFFWGVLACLTIFNYLVNAIRCLSKREKILGPTRRVQFLGLIIDSEKQTIELSEDKLKVLS